MFIWNICAGNFHSVDKYYLNVKLSFTLQLLYSAFKSGWKFTANMLCINLLYRSLKKTVQPRKQIKKTHLFKQRRTQAQSNVCKDLFAVHC